MRKVGVGDWLFLAASFATSLYLIEAQKGDFGLSDLKVRVYWAGVKVCRRLRVAALVTERELMSAVNRELEGR